ncbi:MAG: hypothetical protein PHW77_07285 [Eubacteriales bacterium]|nr:hypothetical protein [Eubacteriales bacterium]
MKRTILAVFLALTLLLPAALASCEEFSKPSLLEQAMNDNAKFLKDAAQKTNDSLIANSPFLKLMQSAMNSGTITLGMDVNDGEDNFQLNGKIYIDNNAFAALLEGTENDEVHNLGIYFKDQTFTLDLKDALDVEPFSLSLDVINSIINEVQYIEPYSQDSADESALDESAMADFATKVSNLLVDIMAELSCTIEEESITVGGEAVACIVTTYTIDDESFTEVITKLLNGMNTIIDGMDDTFKNRITAIIEDLFTEYNDEYYYYEDEYLSTLPLPFAGTLLSKAYKMNIADTEMDDLNIEDILDPDFVIGKLEEIGFSIEGTFKTAVSQAKGYIVYSSFEINAEADEQAITISAEIDLGANASFADDKKMEFKFSVPGTAFKLTYLWDAEETNDIFNVNTYIDAEVKTKMGALTNTTTVRIIELELDYKKADGAFELDISSDLVSLYFVDYDDYDYFGNMGYFDSNTPLFTITGVLLYDKKSVDLTISSISSDLLMDEDFTTPITIKIETGCTMPEIPQADVISSSDELCELLGYEDIYYLVGDIFGTDDEWYDWEDDWDDYAEPEFSLDY